jgi:hypothetical protein
MRVSFDGTARAAGQAVIAIAFLLVGLIMAPLALGAAVAWFVWSGLVYATARRAAGDIIGWVGERDPQAIETAVAHPIVGFRDHNGIERSFTSRIPFRIHDDPPPAGPHRVRYQVSPRFWAELDDPGHWFAGPVLAIVFATAGVFLAWAARVLRVWAFIVP